MAACWIALFIPRFTRGNYGIFLDAKGSVSRCHTLLAESGYDTAYFSDTFINGAHGQWRVADGHWARGSKLCRARPQTWWSDFVRFPDTQRASSEGFQVHVADSSCSVSLRDHCDGHWETSVLAQYHESCKPADLNRGSYIPAPSSFVAAASCGTSSGETRTSIKLWLALGKHIVMWCLESVTRQIHPASASGKHTPVQGRACQDDSVVICD